MAALVRTWFAPFKQTYVGKVRGSLTVHMQAAVDSLISRVIGFLVRTVLLITGAICSLFVLVTGVIFLLVWALIPLLPAIAVVLFGMGVGK